MSLPVERRAFPRAYLDHVTAVQVRIMGAEQAGTLIAADISEAGIGIQMDEVDGFCNLDDEADLLVSLPEEQPFVARGRLRSKSQRSVGHVVGVQFTHVPKEGVAELSRYVTRMLLLGCGG